MDMKQQLSEHFSLLEFTYGGSQMPQESKRFFTDDVIKDALDNLIYTAKQMELVRVLLGNTPIKVHCALRPYKWEIYRRRSGTSKHISGCAVDFSSPLIGTPLEIARLLSKHKDKINYDQLIFEHGWVHISFIPGGVGARKQDLTLNLKTMGYDIGIKP